MTENSEGKKHKKPKSKETELQAKIDELTDLLKRTQADFENYRKRVERDRQENAKFSSEIIIKKILPVIDNFELALQHCKQKDDFYQGVEMIYANLREVLADEGIQPIAAIGLPFDPYRHEALMSVESEQPSNTVLEVMQKGYTLHDKVLRPAKVTISKHKEG